MENTAKTHNIFKSVPIENLIENPNSPSRMSKPTFAKLVRNIERTGLYEPVIVRHVGWASAHAVKAMSNERQATKYEIINGHARVKALKQLGYKNVDVCIWDAGDMQADILSITLNRLSGTDILEKKLALLNRLSNQSDAKQLSELLPFTSGQIERYRNLKLPSKPAKQDSDSFAEPVVFFVNKEQKQIIEQAIQKTASSCKTKSQAITQIAEAFINV